ncbi:tyrosine protein phosphatase [Pseudonocardiaceae bacterium YIM PH 21723]|nr:tyrosine protein phosphatase [Pseudonocardiaceae bacterium YIM PH 21723]
MQPTLYRIDQPGAGQLSFMAAPEGGAQLPEQLRALSALGVHVLVSSLSIRERTERELESEELRAHRLGILWVSLPVPVEGTPAISAARPILRRLAEHLRDGRNIVIHCSDAGGRAPMLATALLALGGVEPTDAWQRVAAARGERVPDNEDQFRWVYGLGGPQVDLTQPEGAGKLTGLR